ncbi:hypothetical protein Pelo_9261 [Pelomyxa schiedti]|nr:hypothetical protein Pelo_9261 [Pelomyxa schiedti]
MDAKQTALFELLCRDQDQPPPAWDVADCSLGSEGAAFVAAVMTTHRSIHTLKISKNSIGSVGVKCICDALKSYQNLSWLDLSCNSLGSEGADLVQSALTHNCTVTFLDVHANSFGDVGANSIATLLRSNNTLTSLDVSDNNFASSGLSAIAEAVPDNKTLLSITLDQATSSTKRAFFSRRENFYTCTNLSRLQAEELQAYMEALQCDNPLKKIRKKIKGLVENNRRSVCDILQHYGIPETCSSSCKDKFIVAMQDCISRDAPHQLSVILNARYMHYNHWSTQTPLSASAQIQPCPSTPATTFVQTQNYVSLFSDQESIQTLLNSSYRMCVLLLQNFVCEFRYMPSWQASQLVKVVMQKKGVTKDELYEVIWMLAREWARAANWQAFKTVLGMMQHADLSYLNLSNIPSDICIMLVNTGCSHLDLTGNHIDSLPSILHAIRSVTLSGNPLKNLPPSFRSAPWPKVQQFLMCNESPCKWNRRKLVLLGDEDAGKTSLLQCLKKGGQVTVKSDSTNGISISKAFRVRKNSKIKWTAWDLEGRDSHAQSNQFFLVSKSVFFLVFNIYTLSQQLLEFSKNKVEIETPSIKQLLWWAKQIRVSQNTSMANNVKLSIFLVGTQLDKITDTQQAAEALVTAVQKVLPHFKPVLHCSAFALSCFTGNTLYIEDVNKLDIVQDIGNGFPQLIESLEACTTTEEYVSVKWVALQKHITKGPFKDTPTITWNIFLETAKELGIGISHASHCSSSQDLPSFASQYACAAALSTVTRFASLCFGGEWNVSPIAESTQEREILECANFLADAGSIIHFRPRNGINTKRAHQSDILQDMVVLKPEWLTSVMNVVGRSGKWIVNGIMKHQHVHKVFKQFPVGTHKPILELLQQFEIAYAVQDGFLLPCSLPTTCGVVSLDANSLLPDWCPFKLGITATIPHIPNTGAVNTDVGKRNRGMLCDYALLMIRILGIPGVSLGGIWRNGMFIHTKSSSGKINCCALITFYEEMRSISLQICTPAIAPSSRLKPTISCAKLTITRRASTYVCGGRETNEKMGSQLFSTVIDAITAFIRGCNLSDDTEQLIPCPHCMASSHAHRCALCRQNYCMLSETNSTNSEPPPIPSTVPREDCLFWFSFRECVDAVKSGSGTLQCKARLTLSKSFLSSSSDESTHQISISIVAPDIALAHLPLISPESLICGPVFASGGFGKVLKAEWKGRKVAVKRPHVEEARALSEFAYEAGIMSSLPPHQNLVQFFGVCARPQFMLVMELIQPVSAPSSLIPSSSIQPWHQFFLKFGAPKKPDLGSLVLYILEGTSALIQQCREGESPLSSFATLFGKLGENEISSVEEKRIKREVFDLIMPLKLRERILHDIACGLNHLHSQFPPLIHSDLHSVLYAGKALGSRNDFQWFAPEVLNGDKYDSKADMWSYGMIAQMLVDPLLSPWWKLMGDQLYSSLVMVRGEPHLELDSLKVTEALVNGKVLPSPPPIQPSEESPSGCPKWANDLMTWCWRPPYLRPTAFQITKWLEGGCTLSPLIVDMDTPCSECSPYPSPISKLLWVGTNLWCGHTNGVVSMVHHISRHFSLHESKVVKIWQAHGGSRSNITSLLWVRNVVQCGIVLSATAAGEIKVWEEQGPAILENPTKANLPENPRPAPPEPKPLATQLNTDTTSEHARGISCLVSVCNGKKLWCGDVSGGITVWHIQTMNSITRESQFAASDLAYSLRGPVGVPQPNGMVIAMATLYPPQPSRTHAECVLVSFSRGPLVLFSVRSCLPVRLIQHPGIDSHMQAACSVAVANICGHAQPEASKEPSLLSPLPSPLPGASPLLLHRESLLSSLLSSKGGLSTSSVHPAPLRGPTAAPVTRKYPDGSLTAASQQFSAILPSPNSTIWLGTTGGVVACWDVLFNSTDKYPLILPHSSFTVHSGFVNCLTTCCTSPETATGSLLLPQGAAVVGTPSASACGTKRPDHHHLVFSSSQDGTVAVWDAAQHTQLQVVEIDAENSVSCICAHTGTGCQSTSTGVRSPSQCTVVTCSPHKDAQLEVWCL